MSINAKTVTIFAMTQSGYEVVRVATQKYSEIVDQVVIGRDETLAFDYSDEIREICEKHSIKYFNKIDNLEIKSNYIIAVSWRWLIDFPTKRLIILHDSLLPKYRGFSPLINALINGETEIGVSAIFGADEYDKGDIIFQKTSNIEYPITIQQAIEINNTDYIYVVRKVFELIQSGHPLPSAPQLEKDASYSIWRDENDYRIDWNQSSEDIRRMIDALGYPYAGASTYESETKVIIESAMEVSDVKCELRDAGKVIFVDNGSPIVICGTGLLKITAAKVMKDNGTFESYLPIKKFRIRFKNT